MALPPLNAQPPCPACGAAAAMEARFCSQCGTPVGTMTPAAGRTVKWYYNLWFVLFMLFFVLGPFGLPLVWKHPRLSRPAKLLLTLAVLLYTVWLIVLTIKAAQFALEHLQQIDSSFAF